MNLDQWADDLRRKADALKNSDRILVLSVGSALSKMGPRIFEKGQDVNGGTRNYNNTDPIWFPDSKAPKGSQNDGKTGRARKTSYYSSYEQFHIQQGRGGSPMNFRLNNDLQSDLLNSSVGRTANVVATPKVKKVNNLEAVISLNRSENVQKANGLERRFGVKIFELSNSEIEVFRDAAAFEFRKLFNQ